MVPAMRVWAVAVTAVFLIAGSTSAKDPQAEQPSIGKKIDAFEMTDIYGKTHKLSDYADKRVLVIYFTGTECPLAKLYAPRMESISQEYASQGVVVLGVNSNRQDSITEIAAFAHRHGVTFPMLKDAGNVVADQFGAQRTPEVFVLNQEREICYQGRIDGTYSFGSGVGFAAPQEKRHDMVEAVKELLAGKSVSVPLTEAKGCIIGRVHRVQGSSEVTYANQISRLFNNRCVKCHRDGQIGPFALTSYEESLGWGEMINEVVQEQRMPPWHANPAHGDFSNADVLTQEEKNMIATWVANGCPEGDPAESPERPTFTDGWLLPREPDQVVHIADEPVDITAEGVEPYRYYTVDPGFTEDKWIRLAECRPGNPAVVHHIIVFVVPPQSDAEASAEARRRRREARRAAKENNTPPTQVRREGDLGGGDGDISGLGFLAGFAPGTRPLDLGPGYAKKIPAGSRLTFQMHYTPVGSPQKDHSAIGLIFMDEKDVTHQLTTSNAATHDFVIPAGADNHVVTARKVFERDTTFLSMFPHMHVRGKAFRYEVTYPDGSHEVLLDIPRYDFNWQNSFILTKPKLFPKGTELLCTAWFDNSEENLQNPNPNEDVRWGDQTWEEMMIGWYDAAFPVDQVAQLVKENDAKQSGNPDR